MCRGAQEQWGPAATAGKEACGGLRSGVEGSTRGGIDLLGARHLGLLPWMTIMRMTVMRATTVPVASHRRLPAPPLRSSALHARMQQTTQVEQLRASNRPALWCVAQ